MIKCPFCHYDNEDGALFCERCTSDLTGVAPSPSPAKAVPPPPPPRSPLPAIPVAEAMPIAMAMPYEATPVYAEAVPYEAIPMVPTAMPYNAIPVAVVEPFEAIPVAKAEPFAAIPMSLEPPAPPHMPKHPIPAIEAISMPALASLAVPAVEPMPPSAPVPPPAPAATPALEPVAAPPAGFMPPNAQPRLLVLRGQKRNVEYPIFEGPNFLGRADDKPVDIDLEEQEPPDRVWCSRQHAVIFWESNELSIEDLNSANGTYVNRTRVHPGSKRPLTVNDIVQIGNVQLKVVI